MNARDGIQLSGTLTIPEKPLAGVILVSGSGPQDRDQLFMGHRTFWVLADYLTRQGIAVLRYDDRGVAQSEGHFQSATSYDFARDASAAIDFLAQQTGLSGAKIGIIGHSEGGLIAPVVASTNARVDFIVLLAGPSRSGRFVSENQIQKILLSNGMSEETALAGSAITAALNDVVVENPSLPAAHLAEKLRQTYTSQWHKTSPTAQTQLEKLGGGSLPDHRIKMLVSDWYKAFLQHDPVDYLVKLDIPVYALFGDKDVQVSAQDHVATMRDATSRSALSQVQVLANHNHLFQQTKSGSMAEYQHIEETLSLIALQAIKQWILGVRAH